MHWSVRAPFFFGTRLQGNLKTWGDTARSFGHKIARADNRTDGVFAEWSWNGETLTVQNDRYGFFPLFYYAKGSEIGVSPSISTLIAEGADAELNDESVALFLRLGQFIGNDTPFRHIHCLPPNATLVWNGSNPHVTGDYEHVPENRPVSRTEAVHRYIELFAVCDQQAAPRLSSVCRSAHRWARFTSHPARTMSRRLQAACVCDRSLAPRGCSGSRPGG